MVTDVIVAGGIATHAIKFTGIGRKQNGTVLLG